MADTNHVHAAGPVEGDGVSYRGIGWFIVVLVGTTLFCQVFVWGLFKAMDWRVTRSEPARALLAEDVGKREIDAEGRVVTGAAKAPAISLQVNEPSALRAFHAREDATLGRYNWIDKGAQTVTLPIDRAKDLLVERGLPVRAAEATAVAAAPADGSAR